MLVAILQRIYAMVPAFMCLDCVPHSTTNDAIMFYVASAEVCLPTSFQWLRQRRLFGVQHGPIALCAWLAAGQKAYN